MALNFKVFRLLLEQRVKMSIYFTANRLLSTQSKTFVSGLLLLYIKYLFLFFVKHHYPLQTQQLGLHPQGLLRHPVGYPPEPGKCLFVRSGFVRLGQYKVRLIRIFVLDQVGLARQSQSCYNTQLAALRSLVNVFVDLPFVRLVQLGQVVQVRLGRVRLGYKKHLPIFHLLV